MTSDIVKIHLPDIQSVERAKTELSYILTHRQQNIGATLSSVSIIPFFVVQNKFKDFGAYLN